jgi:hypothetical protein
VRDCGSWLYVVVRDERGSRVPLREKGFEAAEGDYRDTRTRREVEKSNPCNIRLSVVHSWQVYFVHAT